jgi:hypothetical protein
VRYGQRIRNDRLKIARFRRDSELLLLRLQQALLPLLTLIGGRL